MVASRRTKEQVSGDRKRVMEEKLSFLALIEQNIKHLEGQFDNSHTRESRLDKWHGIAAMVIANGWRSLCNVVVGESSPQTLWGRLSDNDIALAKSGNIPATNKLVAYLRDSKWGDLKKRYKVKKDKNAQTGSGGGSSCTLDEMDIVVERILGTGSKASVDGLEVLSDGVPDIIGQEERVATDRRSLAEAAVSLKASQENYVKQKTEYYRLLCEKLNAELGVTLSIRIRVNK
ncbi:hypothetical protein FOL46_008783 [Perkinsus olseni]|uniref:Uncharacterized protein n=1 Tax=Perkinsus olseni TaxID=32597 RepID=A0A7J6L530_PEROL|nr:hypothetical protein FOL46_008783 [Perkinsus olseni]